MRQNTRKNNSRNQSKNSAQDQASYWGSISITDTILNLNSNIETGLTKSQVEERIKLHGYNEVLEKKSSPVLRFLRKFWGLSPWMLELIIILSAIMKKYQDLVVVSVLLIVNAILSFVQENRASGVLDSLRQRLQVSARVLRDGSWQLIPARESGSGRHYPASHRRHYPGGY